MQIKKERQETVKIKQKIAESISEYEDFVFETRRRLGIVQALPNTNDDKKTEEIFLPKESNIMRQTAQNIMKREKKPIVENIYKIRPTTSNMVDRGKLNRSGDIGVYSNYDSAKINEDLKMLNREGNLFFKKRNVMSAVPKGLPPRQYKRMSIKTDCENGMRHGKFVKFLDFLLELREDGISMTDKDMTKGAGKRRHSYKSPLETGSHNGFEDRDYYIYTIALEAQNYFKLDEIRKDRIKGNLLTQLNEEKRKKDRVEKEIKLRENDIMRRSEVVEEFEKAIMEVSEDLIQRKTQSSIINSKAKRIDVTKIQEEYLRNIGEDFFKASDKRKVLKIFCNSEPIKKIIHSYSRDNQSESLVFLKPGMKNELISKQD